MRLIIVVILIGIMRSAFGQDSVVFDNTPFIPNSTTCEKAATQADIDSKANTLRIARGPLFGDEYERFYRNYMVTKYGIEIVGRGCITFDFEYCYTDRMQKIIEAKNGDNFFIRTEDSIKKEFKIFKTLVPAQRKKYIDFDFTYKIVDHKADYIEGYANLVKELHKRIDFSKLDFQGKIIGLNLVIGQTGAVNKCEVLSKGLSGADAEKIKNTVKELHWIPARLYGFEVKSEKIIGIPTTLD
ncbi:MAG: hypothetical protein JSS79_14270 [Bacteroidetes bacterium]|nr:hypothetical protein [Bacteroidota bacterium]